MSRIASSHDECVILVKALPHRSSNYFETVCCAGLGRNLRWRRLYPVPYRILREAQKFGRWHWLEYDFTSPAHDGRVESQRVVPESINVGEKLKEAERSRIACNITRESTDEAFSRGETLTLLKPTEVDFRWKRKSDAELSGEKVKHAELANQLSLLNEPAEPLEPCPFEFTFKWKTESGTDHFHTCDDWETSTAFFRRRAKMGEQEALNSLKATYEVDYLNKGMRFALGTHSRRKNQWLLVGVLRVDDQKQGELF